MGNTIIDTPLAALIAQAADIEMKDLGSAIVDNKEILTTEDSSVVDAIDENSYHHLGIDLGPVEILNVEGKKVHAWTQAPTAFAA